MFTRVGRYKLGGDGGTGIPREERVKVPVVGREFTVIAPQVLYRVWNALRRSGGLSPW